MDWFIAYMISSIKLAQSNDEKKGHPMGNLDLDSRDWHLTQNPKAKRYELNLGQHTTRRMKPEVLRVKGANG